MPDTQILLQGLSISISGLLITFLSLGTFILVISLLQRIFPARTQKDNTISATVSDTQGDASNELEIAAAISAALYYWRARQKSALGKDLENGRGPFWSTAQNNIANLGTRTNRSKQ